MNFLSPIHVKRLGIIFLCVSFAFPAFADSSRVSVESSSEARQYHRVLSKEKQVFGRIQANTIESIIVRTLMFAHAEKRPYPRVSVTGLDTDRDISSVTLPAGERTWMAQLELIAEKLNAYILIGPGVVKILDSKPGTKPSADKPKHS